MKTLIGTWLGTENLTFVELAIKLKYHWLAIDLEHTGISIDFCNQVLSLCMNNSIEVYVRIPSHDPAIIKKVLDMGADGIIAPMVETKDELIKLKKSIHYAPDGNRGVGLNRAHGFGLDFNNYLKKSKELKLIAQIESEIAIKNLDEIIDRDLIHAAIIGPYDLSSSFNTPGKFHTNKMKNSLKLFLKTCKSKNVRSGYHIVSSDPTLVNQKIKEGYSFIAFGVDFIFLQESMKNGLDRIIK